MIGLESLGLTQIEAMAYAYLVANPSSTGYRVARGIGKPTANVYRALESLGRKGAVVRDRAATPSFRALAPDDLLSGLEREFMHKKAVAARELAALRPDEGDERLYALQTAEQVFARARIVLAAARRLVWMDSARDVVAAFTNEIDDARSRGARVVVRVRSLAATDPVRSPDAFASHPDTLVDTDAARPGAVPSLRMVVDAREALLAWFAPDRSRAPEAVWTRSAHFARAMHDALASERFCARVERGLADGLSVDEVETAYEDCRELRELV